MYNIPTLKPNEIPILALFLGNKMILKNNNHSGN